MDFTCHVKRPNSSWKAFGVSNNEGKNNVFKRMILNSRWPQNPCYQKRPKKAPDPIMQNYRVHTF
jgi:hypothetical protein